MFINQITITEIIAIEWTNEKAGLTMRNYSYFVNEYLQSLYDI